MLSKPSKPTEQKQAERPEAPAEAEEQSKAARSGARPGGRSARVVHSVLEATLAVFAEVGYAGLSVEQVAERAAVNKTTVYRRWATKAALVEAALFHMRDEEPEAPDTGSLRADLHEILRRRAERMAEPRLRAVMHALILGNSEPELSTIGQRLRRERPVIPHRVLQRAIERGELPPHTDGSLLAELCLGPLHTRVYWKREQVTEAYITTLVDWVVAGARGCQANAKQTGPSDASAEATERDG